MKNRLFSTAVVIRGLSIALAAGLTACSDTPLPLYVDVEPPPEPLQLHGALAFGYSGDANGAFAVSATLWLEPDGRLRGRGRDLPWAYAVHDLDVNHLYLLANRPRAGGKSDLLTLDIRDVVLSRAPRAVDWPSFGGSYEIDYQSGYYGYYEPETTWITHAGKVEYRVADGRITGAFGATACSGPGSSACPPPPDWPYAIPPQIELSGEFDLPLLRSEGGRLFH
jgi:hypothetical protein